MNTPMPLPVDLWLVSLDNADAVNEQALTDDAERLRLSQIVPAQRRGRFAFRRQALRYVLGRYLPRYTLDVGPTGKPCVRASSGRLGLRFSVSASKALCAVSVCRGETGVDIEVNPPQVDVAGIVRQFMPRMQPSSPWARTVAPAQGESRELQAFRQHLAVMSWCRLEAYTKLHGQTLHAVLFGGTDPTPQLRSEDHHAVAVACLDYVCVVAHAQPFHIARIEQIDYARIRREQAQPHR